MRIPDCPTGPVKPARIASTAPTGPPARTTRAIKSDAATLAAIVTVLRDARPRAPFGSAPGSTAGATAAIVLPRISTMMVAIVSHQPAAAMLFSVAVNASQVAKRKPITTAGITLRRPTRRMRGAAGSTRHMARMPSKASPRPDREEVKTSASILTPAIPPPSSRKRRLWWAQSARPPNKPARERMASALGRESVPDRRGVNCTPVVPANERAISAQVLATVASAVRPVAKNVPGRRRAGPSRMPRASAPR